MAKYVVEVTGASVTSGTFHTTCVCTCGWTTTTTADSEAGALQSTSKARVDHLQDAHPEQAPSAFFRPKARARYLHVPSISVAVREQKRFSRVAACSCGWSTAAGGRSADRAGHDAVDKHRDHVNLETERTPARDYILLVGLVLFVGVVMIAMAVVAIEVSDGNPRNFTGS